MNLSDKRNTIDDNYNVTYLEEDVKAIYGGKRNEF